MRTVTQGATQWLQTLKQHWDIRQTALRSNEEAFVVVHFSKSNNVTVGYYDRVTGEGHVLDRRQEVRCER